jgi:hypothetical protein
MFLLFVEIGLDAVVYSDASISATFSYRRSDFVPRSLRQGLGMKFHT